MLKIPVVFHCDSCGGELANSTPDMEDVNERVVVTILPCACTEAREEELLMAIAKKDMRIAELTKHEPDFLEGLFPAEVEL